MTSLNPCLPPWWARGGHNQTVLGHLLPSPPLAYELEPRRIELPDGDVLLARHWRGTSDTSLSFFHGLAGDISADYMRRGANLAIEAGHSVWLVNHRGSGEGHGLAKQPYHSGRGEDLAAAIAEARRQEPGKKQIAVGFSISGNALLCLLSGLAPGEPPDAAIAVNAPIDLEACARLLHQGFNRVYGFRFVRRLRNLVREQRRMGIPNREQRIPYWSSLADFDELFTAPVCGFGTRRNYYAQCSTHLHLNKIDVPTVLLASEDDPFIDIRSYREAQLAPGVRLHVEKSGGHMGYLSGRGPRRWLDAALAHYVAELRADLNGNSC